MESRKQSKIKILNSKSESMYNLISLQLLDSYKYQIEILNYLLISNFKQSKENKFSCKYEEHI